jgi:hypothetical protein
MLPSTYSTAIGPPVFKLDEGFSEDPRGQDDTDLATTMENTSGFEEWVMAQSEDARAGKIPENDSYILQLLLQPIDSCISTDSNPQS